MNGNMQAVVEPALTDLQRQDTVKRIWRRDHTVWKPNPDEIANRLGWLDVAVQMRRSLLELEDFGWQMRDAGFRHVVLLGMGGSSLGPEVLRQAFGSGPGYPELIVLDSTVPAWIAAVTDAIDPEHTLFLVSSKSGGTIETLSFYRYFRGLLEKEMDKDSAGRNFVAITDSGASLAEMARDEGFRRAFLNPEDIGGRYSVLSYFGLVPGTLIGLNLAALLGRAEHAHARCKTRVPIYDNPGASLGVAMGALARQGRDKLTLVTSPSIDSFGLWAEQLIAESTGKEGRGIIPVAGEPILAPEYYGDDRLFVYLRLDGDDNAGMDTAMERVRSAGQPVLRLDMIDLDDLGAEFFRWEFAVAIAGSVLGINPFDQPNVQQSKDITGGLLREYQASGQLPPVKAESSLPGLLSQAGPGDYLAIMAYVNHMPEVDEAVAGLRRRVMGRYRIATTFGYGPRFLHSTGQLHKGGPGNGLFLQLTAGHDRDVEIPGEEYTFGTLADAQALGDLRALQEMGRRVVRVQLGQDIAADIRNLADELA